MSRYPRVSSSYGKQGMKDSSGCQKAPWHLSAIRCIPSLFSPKLKSLPKGRPHVETVEMRARRMDSPSSEARTAHSARVRPPSLTHTRDKRAAVCKMAVVRRARRRRRHPGGRGALSFSHCRSVSLHDFYQRKKAAKRGTSPPHPTSLVCTRHFPPFSSFLLTTVHSLRHPCSKRGRMKRQC